MHAAICLTGMERSFAEIGANVREGVISLLGDSHTVRHAVYFGVRPPFDECTSVRQLLPFAEAHLETQRRCWTSGMQPSSGR